MPVAMEGMPRRPREEEAGAIHHVYSRGNGKQLVFFDDEDRAGYLDLLARAVVRAGWRCLSYCLMPNHLHLLIETPQPNLGAGMQWFHGHYAGGFNKKWGRSGHLFQGRYGNVRVKTDEQLQTVVRYIALNPVAAKLSRAPEDWLWGSHRAAVSGEAAAWLDHARLLEYIGIDGGEPGRRYLELVTAPAAVTPPSRGPAPTGPPR